MSVIFDLEEVSYGYQKAVPVLSALSLSIYQGERLAILGANGCGKSTLLKLLDGLIFPTHGRMKAFDQVLTEKNLETNPFDFHRKVGFVFQDSDVQLFAATVFDEVAFAPLQLDWGAAVTEQRVHETLWDFGLWELKERPPFRLSGGEKKKTALAAVTVYQPEVLLLDEPTNSLDPRTRKWLVKRLREFNQDGTTIVIATHDLDLAEHFADRVLVIDESHRIAALGAPHEILADKKLLTEVNLI